MSLLALRPETFHQVAAVISSCGVASIIQLFSPILWDNAPAGSVALIGFSNLCTSLWVSLEGPNFGVPRSYLAVTAVGVGGVDGQQWLW